MSETPKSSPNNGRRQFITRVSLGALFAAAAPELLVRDVLAAPKASRKKLDQFTAMAKHHYAELLRQGGHLEFITSAGNGGEPVLILHGPQLDKAKPLRAHVHYHGWNETVVAPDNSRTKTEPRATEIMMNDPQTIVVIPECKNAPLDARPHYKTDWSNATSQKEVLDDTLRALKIDEKNVAEVTVSAHSGGGMALHFIMKKHPDGSGLKADRLELMDCLYDPAPQSIATWEQTKNGQNAEKILYCHGTNKPKQVKFLLDNLKYLDEGFDTKEIRRPNSKKGDHNATVWKCMDTSK